MTIKWTRITLFWLIMIVLFVVSIYFVGKLYLLDPLENKKTSIEQKVDTQSMYIENAEMWQETVSGISTETLHKLPITKGNNQIVRMMDQAVKDSGLTIEQILVEEKSPEEGDNLHRLMYQVEGIAPSYESFQQFVTQIIANERIIEIFELSIDREDKTEAAFQFNIQFYAFYAPDFKNSNQK
ncbi:type 4a pilus biogenesis protein PilO [Gracilibacillus thailandensis]|uniref:Type 4a pilus biogenesis protein PilO n=1 Tax=Gracilibacillus thailandensis TaxID=563735 RepID=A0A6N7R290_9BACI|nr:type 4a pilus biogenesis protein PilO [Gracilibacillus thailandensis]MRI67600.1 type 4a pilus biogenesis protein PilO [Gracilibacillus thailandensis]